MSRSTSASLDFIDSDHLLLTFRAAGLLKRLPECQPDDEDQLIRALVVHLPDGEVVKSAEWRMHDRGRYLWPLRGGRFLVRQRDVLLTTDATLALKPIIEANAPIRLVKLSPDAHLLLVETDVEKHSLDDHQRLVEEANLRGLSPPREDVQLTVLNVDDLKVVARSRIPNPSDLPLVSEGYVEALPAKGNHWMVRYFPFQGDPSVVADIVSSCRPVESPLNENTIYVNTCAESSGEHLIQALSLGGKKLWNYRWDSRYIWPTTSVSEDGRHFAFSTLRVSHPVSAFAPLDDDGSSFEAQRIEVIDVETGRVELTQFATPVLSGGQNYALSPDGRRFAVLRENAVEIYDQPPAK